MKSLWYWVLSCFVYMAICILIIIATSRPPKHTYIDDIDAVMIAEDVEAKKLNSETDSITLQYWNYPQSDDVMEPI